MTTTEKSPMVEPLLRPPFVRGQWIPMTSEEFDDWIPDGMQGEWVRGKGIIFVPPTKGHQQGALILAELFRRFTSIFDLGEVIISPFEMRLFEGLSRREPDILFVRSDRVEQLTEPRLLGPADLAVEILSPDSLQRDLRDKLAEYEEARVGEYLIVDFRPRGPRRDLMLYRLNDEGRYNRVEADERGAIHFASLPGFWLHPAWLRETPLPDSLTLLKRISPEAWRRTIELIDRA